MSPLPHDWLSQSCECPVSSDARQFPKNVCSLSSPCHSVRTLSSQFSISIFRQLNFFSTLFFYSLISTTFSIISILHGNEKSWRKDSFFSFLIGEGWFEQFSCGCEVCFDVTDNVTLAINSWIIIMLYSHRDSFATRAWRWISKGLMTRARVDGPTW